MKMTFSIKESCNEIRRIRSKTIEFRSLVKGVAVLCMFFTIPLAQAQPTGVTEVVEFTIRSSNQPMVGWSVKQGLLGRPIYDDLRKQIGTIEDLLVTLAADPYVLVIGVGGFLEIGGHAVAVPLGDIIERNGLLNLPGATRKSLKDMPRLNYVQPKIWHAQFIKDASLDLVVANKNLVRHKEEASIATGNAKEEIELNNADLQSRITIAEEKLTEFEMAESEQWMQIHQKLQEAISHLKASKSNSLDKR